MQSYPNMDMIDINKWPAQIFAASLTPSDIILAMKLIVSIIDNNGANTIGEFWGVNEAKKWSKCIIKEFSKQNKIIVKDIPIVIDICVDMEKKYGNIPTTFMNNITKNILFIKV